MKKSIIILILLPFLYLNIGFYPFFLLKQQIIKKEIKAKIKANLSKDELTEMVFDKATFKSLKWIDEKEFSINNQMYDVVKIANLHNDSVFIQCIEDKKESLLFAQLDNLTKTDPKSKQNKEFFLSKLLIKGFVPIKKWTFECYFKTIHCYKTKTILYNSYILDKPCPPPKYC